LIIGSYFGLLQFLLLLLHTQMTTGLVAVTLVGLTLGMQSFLDLILLLGTQRGSLLSPNPLQEYCVVVYIVAKIVWTRKQLLDLGMVLTSPVKVYYDNVSATYLTANPVHHDHSKYIAVDYHFVRERVAHDDLVVRHVPTML